LEFPLFSWFEKRINVFQAPVSQTPPSGFFEFLWATSRDMRPYILVMTLCTALIGAAEAWLFSLLSNVVDRLSRIDVSQLWADGATDVIWLIAILVLSPFTTGLQTLIKHQTLAVNFAMRLRWDFHRLMLGQSMGFYQDEFAGRVATKVMQTALASREVWFIVADILVFVIIYFGTIIAVAGGFATYLLLPFLGWLLLYLLALWFFVPRLGVTAKSQADARSLMTGRITDAYTNIATVKLFSHANREANYARSAMQDFMVTAYGQMRLVSAFEVVNQLLSALLIGATTGMTLWLWQRGDVGVGAVAAATAMAMRLNGISHWIMWEMATLFEHVGTVQDGINTLSKSNAVLDAPDATALTVPKGEVQFESVQFSYNSGKAVVRDFDLHIHPGEKIGLVGRSGAGKSTMVNLLLRFYDLQGGRILIDGQNIAEVTQESLRQHIGMVTQDTSLLHRSVRDNIAYGRPDATDADIMAAARGAQADEFIATLGDLKGRTGLDAHVGERGVKLSGGQRQRIAIARVMLKNAPILLLDEATSALDSEVEVAIQASLNRLMDGKTVVAIAHRLSTIAAMDRLVVMDQGRIVEQGTHAQLLQQGGLYARLWEHQSGGFLGEDG
jgi:ATP-binding cassette subfamily B multidrug efflux pump